MATIRLQFWAQCGWFRVRGKMALCRKFFYRKPPEGLLEISERVYVFDCCFTTTQLGGDEYEVYIGDIVDQLREYFPDSSFIVFSFGDGDYQRDITSVLDKHGITVVDYPSQNESCPVLTVEMIHHFLRSSESWLCIGQRNVLLMHCQNGSYPVLVFMLSAFLIYWKQHCGERKTLDMVYKQAPLESMHSLSPIDPLPSQLRYLQYVSRRNIGSRWPPLDRALTLDCVILRAIPNMDGKGGCRPIFRVYGPDPLMAADPKTKLLFSMSKRNKSVIYFRQADYEIVKLDINCHVQGDVVLECVTLDDSLEYEEIMFRAMFNTAFIRSNVLMLTCDELDTVWDAKDHFPKEFRVEVIFSDMDSTSSIVMCDSPPNQEIEGLPIEAFSQVHDIFNDLDWGDTEIDNALNIIQQMTVSSILEEKLDFTGFPGAKKESWQNPAPIEKDEYVEDLKVTSSGDFHPLVENETSYPPASSKSSFDFDNFYTNNTGLHVSVQRPAQSKIISPRLSQASPFSQPVYASSPQGSFGRLTRYCSAPVGITDLLEDDDEIESSMSAVTPSSMKSGLGAVAAPPPPPPPLHSSPDLSSSTPPPPPPPPTIGTAEPPHLPSVPCPPPPPPPSSPKIIPPPMGVTPPPPPASYVPPPPAPSKPGASSSMLFSPATAVVGGKKLLRAGVKSQAKKASLKPYHWLKLTRAMQGSLWAETQKPEEASKAPELDLGELESLFSATVPNSDPRKTYMCGSTVKSDKVHLIELRRAYNCEIMLTKVKIPVSDLMNSVLALDDSALDVDQVENLIKFCPTKEEIELLKNYKGDFENLGKCEQFFMELMKVPRVEAKLRVFSFKIQFCSQISDLRQSLNVVNSISEEVRNSVKLKRIMQTILSLGNALNKGTARGSAVGFRLDSLPKLAETRARNNKLTLINYLCKVLAEKLPEVLDFDEDLVNLEAATKIQLKYLAEEMQAITKGIEKVVQELTASENDGAVSERFCTILKNFLGTAEAEVRSLAARYSGVGRNADSLTHYFGEDPARCPFEQVVSTLLNFVRMFRKAHEENCKQLEFEKKKKAQEETENEKLKGNASSKELDNENGIATAAKLPGLL
ncbi:formin-like protein 18 [Salvia splendens]|uniref:formin-like protein 18 n=1 Tax=Salvia splendens TaxID=180675 RepID=UPI001C25929D|nr:formin-like protein 18 [Salvia splendens]